MENESSDAEEQNRGNGNEDVQPQKSQQEQHQQYLGDISQGLPAFPQILATEPLPGNIAVQILAFYTYLNNHKSRVFFL